MKSPEPGAPGDFHDEAPCGLLTTTQDGRIEWANQTFCRWVGRTLDSLRGQVRFQDLLTVGGRIFHQTHFAPLMQMQGSVSEVKLDLRRADGATFPIMVNAARREAGGVVTHALAVFVAKERHAYERELMLSRRHAEALAEQQKRAQEELRDADRRKDEFLAMLAHELRNPLAPIAMSAQLLKIAADDPPRVARVAEVIERQIRHLTDLVDDLLDVSRVTRGLIDLNIAPIEVDELLAAAIEQARPLMDARGHALRVDQRAMGCVPGDRTRMVQVLVNLLNNAAKYTPHGGSIELAASLEGDRWRIDVVDDGIGMDATLLPHVFDLFSQAERTPDRSQGGLGIGLALVRSLVHLHGGTVEAHSEGPDRGSRFTVRFPRVPGARTGPPPAPVREPASAASTTVLIVDDNRDAAGMLGDVMRLAGHAVQIAGSAGEALELLASGRFLPAVCVLDIGLPDLSGYELASRIRKRMADAPPLLVALTGYGQPHDLASSKAAGFDHHYVKPADPALLLEVVNEAASRRLAHPRDADSRGGRLIAPGHGG